MGAFLVLGGFEPSGHDSTAEAVIEAGRARGHQLDYLRWRDLVDVADHPMFVSHRQAAAQGASEVAGLLDEPWIGAALAADLAHHVETRYDGYVSVHPWSSLIAGAALAGRDAAAAPLIDYHSDFGDFPVIEHARITAYLGGGRIRALEPRIRARCHVAGVAVPKRFHAGSSDLSAQARPSLLVVSAGSDGWAVRAMRDAAQDLVAQLAPEQVILLAPSEEAANVWTNRPIDGASLVCGVSDIAPLLRRARWYLSKGGGTAVAEGLAAGCLGFVARAGIFWEDAAAEYLHAQGTVCLVERARAGGRCDEARLAHAIVACREAADRLWRIIEDGALPRRDPVERRALDEIARQIDRHGPGPLPTATTQLAARVRAWRDGWQ